MAITKINLTDYEKMIYDYMVTVLKAKYPSMDLSPSSVVAEVFLNSMIEILKPFISQMNYMDLIQDFENADLIDPDDMDRIVWHKYGLVRNQGVHAHGEIVISFENIPASGTLKIPAGTTVSKATDSRIKYITTQEYTFTTDQLIECYDTTEYVYKVPVPFRAQEVGSEYNILIAGELSVLETQISGVSSVRNPDVIINGIDPETNSQLADRVKRSHMAKILSSVPGYRENVKKEFPTVVDVYVAGYKDELMLRDFDPVSGRHLGGMVDLIIYGGEEADVIEDFVINGDATGTLAHAPHVHIPSVYNLTQQKTIPFKNYEIHQQEYFDSGWKAISEVKILESSAYLPDDVYEISCAISELGAPAQNTVLNAPVDEDGVISLETTGFIVRIDALTNTRTEETLIEDNYEMILESGDETQATAREKVHIRFLNPYYYSDGDVVTVQYKCNKTIGDIQAYYDVERDACADVLAVMGKCVYFNVKIGVILTTGSILDAGLKERIFNAANRYFRTLRMGGVVDQSSFLSYIKNDADVGSSIVAIKLPIDSFEHSHERVERITHVNQGAFTLAKNEYPLLYKFEVYAANDQIAP